MDLKYTKRDKNGLISGVDYVFDDNGMIDWRKMVKPEYLYPNPSKNLAETDVTKLKDYELCILLSGLKELAQIRGYTKVEYDINSPSSDYVVASCKITWIPNYESEGREVVFSSVADSSIQNTSPIFGYHFLATAAENRAFVRCVRNFLRINIVSKEEMAESAKVNKTSSSSHNNTHSTESSDSATESLLKAMSKKKLSFDQVKSQLIKEGFDGAEDFQSVDDIPKNKIFALISRINKAKAVKKS